jgi:hypothetical protein
MHTHVTLPTYTLTDQEIIPLLLKNLFSLCLKLKILKTTRVEVHERPAVGPLWCPGFLAHSVTLLPHSPLALSFTAYLKKLIQ